MKTPENKFEIAAAMRQKAETQLQLRKDALICSCTSTAGAASTKDIETLKLIHELEVHQIQLEMQNEELALARYNVELTSQKQEEIYDFAPSGYFTLSKEGIILELNLCASQMLGSNRMHLTNRLLALFVSHDTKPVYYQFLESLFKASAKVWCDITLDAANKLPMYVHLTGIVSDNGEECFVTAVDITAHKLAEKALKMSEAKYRILFETMKNGYYRSTPEGYYVDANPAFIKMLGYKDKEELLKVYIPTDLYIHPEERIGFIENYEKYLTEIEAYRLKIEGADMVWIENSTQYIEDENGKQIPQNSSYVLEVYRLKTKSGNIIWLEDNARYIKDANGKVIFNEGICIDITERVQMKEDKKKLQEKLYQVQKLESLGVLAGGIAHDFNNLMAGIYGYIDLASAVSNDAKVTNYLSKTLTTIDRARGLTAQLLTFAKGGAPIQKIGHLFPFVKETANFALSGANVLCNFDVPPELWACNFDKNQIEQVIDNLILNAQQAMPVGGVIELSARNITIAEKEHPLLTKGNYVKLSIKDSGIGIPKELLTKIFDPFFTTKTKGHGLGLATSYSIINRHGGFIDVESEPGKGSTFHVYLPASAEEPLSAQNKPATMHVGSGTFLIMDDEQVVSETIGAMLTSMGYDVVCKENGADAVEYFVSETIAKRTLAGMIFDLTVPNGMGGKEAVAEIRKINTEIPVFVTSGYSEDPVIKHPTDYGFMASICKPFKIIELLEMLNKYLNIKHDAQ